MPWDDLHESGKSGNRGGGSQGGGSQDKPPFDIPQIQIPKFKPSMFWIVGGLLLMVWIIPGTFYFVEPDEEGSRCNLRRILSYYSTWDAF